MNLFNNMEYTGLSPIIKWAGGKEKELVFIFSNIPSDYDNFYEPFVGGGSVFMALNAKRYYINDISNELIELYRSVALSNQSFYNWMKEITTSWKSMLMFADTHRDLCTKYVDYREDRISDVEMKSTILFFLETNAAELNNVLSSKFLWHRDVYDKELKKNLLGKISRMKKIEKKKHIMPEEDVFDNIETALMSALYMYFRNLYNDRELCETDIALGTALFVFIRNYAYSGMFRYNSNGEFNVPYGGIGYNHKLLDKKIEYYKSKKLIEHFKTTNIFNMDFEEFFKNNPPQSNDFIFLDPPYDSTFSTYAKNEFSKNDQKRLANYLINECKGKWMMIIKNTSFIYSLYDNEKLTIKTFDKKYNVSFMNRNDRNAEHLIIMNYK
ncbi:MAG: DNA adenine methylase [Prevotella sp.]|nr:DNA adenine methylase [Prevotella sp.]